MPDLLLVKLAVSAADTERLGTGLSVAAAAVAAGVAVRLWLANDASWLAVPGEWGRFEDDARELYLGAADGSRVSVCARCASRRGITAQDVGGAVSIEGAAAFVAAVMAPGTRVLVY